MVKTIRRSQDLELRIDELDVKIGLLVHNRISVQVSLWISSLFQNTGNVALNK